MASVARRYTIEELRAMNRPDLKTIPPEVMTFLERLPIIKTPGQPYLNKYNPHLFTESINNNIRKPLFAKAPAFTDEKLVGEVRVLLGKLSKENIPEITERLSKLRYSGTCWPAIAECFHHAAIDCVFLVETYITTLLRWISLLPPESGTALATHINQRIHQQLKEPRVFDAAMDETALELAADKGKRWQLANSRIIAELFLQGKYTVNFIQSNLLAPTLASITPQKTIGIEICKTVLPLIGTRLEAPAMKSYLAQLRQISEDKAYPSRLRFIIMDVLDAHK